ncbi:MAG: hypothetical protein WCE96_04580, partial [Nitrososphaeraceae archaeon]
MQKIHQTVDYKFLRRCYEIQIGYDITTAKGLKFLKLHNKMSNLKKYFDKCFYCDRTQQITSKNETLPNLHGLWIYS